MTINPTGEQYSIAFGRFTAVVTQVGATLRSFQVDGKELLWTFDADQAPQASQGRQLLPWPNRIRDGRYIFNGIEYQLPINEVGRRTALHGLHEGVAWELVAHRSDEVQLATTIFPQQGFHATLRIELSHRLTAEGLSVSVSTTNVGDTSAPYGYGAHPYFAIDPDQSQLQFSFTEELLADAERLLPISLTQLSAEHDFSTLRTIGQTEFDTAFTGSKEGLKIELLTAEHRICVWGDESVTWGQLYIPPARNAIAIEPMTCGPDAFNPGPTHADLQVLAPGENVTTQWGISLA